MKKRAKSIGKRFVFVALALTMVFTALPLTALPVAAATSGDFVYEVLSEDNKTCSITEYTGTAAELEIPSALDGYTVTSIGDSAFLRCDTLTSVVLPDSITSIMDSAFFNCTALTSVSIANGVITIGTDAFSRCWSLCNINIPNSVKIICSDAFANCEALTDIMIPASVTDIGAEAFSHCTSLTDITIMNDAPNIGINAFDDTAYYNTASNWENDVLYLGEHLIKANHDVGGTYTVKDGTKTIASYAFAYCAIDSISIPNSVVNINEGAFYNCTALTNVICPSSVETVGAGAFMYCASLSSVTLTDGTTSIGYCAFYSCTALENISLPDSVTSIGVDAFFDTAYYNTESNWENDVLYIGNSLIRAKESLSGPYTIKEGTKAIADSAFFGCVSLTDITIPNNVTTINYYVFAHCEALTSVVIPNSVTSIGYEAFFNCFALIDITIPKSVTYIAPDAFPEYLPRVTIFGYFNSYAESYANENGYPFAALDLVKDAQSGISVLFPPENLPAKNTILHIEKASEEFDTVFYNITLTVNDEITQPSGAVTVKIPVPTEMDSTQCKIYREEANGTYTNMDAVYQAGYMVFMTTYFSTYVLTTNFLDVTVGDVNGDNAINAIDARCILQVSSGIRELDDIQKSAADVNGDNKINAIDARWILQAASGSREL